MTTYTQISGIPATPNTVEDIFNLTINNKCYADVLQQLSSTSTKEAYSGATMKLPAMQFSHSDGFTTTICPVAITYQVSEDNGGTWFSSGVATYDNLIPAGGTSNGAVTIVPVNSAFASGTSTRRRDVRVTYTNSVTGQALVDQFIVNVHPSKDIAILANSQLDTLVITPHPDVNYVVGSANLAVPTTDLKQNYPVDPSGLNDFTSTSLPSISYKLQFLSGSTWTDITTANYQTTGVVGLTSTPCMLNGSLSAPTFSFTVSCTDNSKFGTTSIGQDQFNLRYVVWYTDVTASIRYLYDPFMVTIFNQCTEATLSIADASRTAPFNVFVTSVATTVSSKLPSITITPAACTTVDALVEVYDDVNLMNWTSLTTNTFYSKFLTDGTTPQVNTNPALTIKPDTAFFTTIKVVQVRVTYTQRNSQVTNGANKIVDQFAVTVYPTPYDVDCAAISLSSTPIADFTLNVVNAAGTSASDKQFVVTNAAVAGCTNGLTWAF